MTLTVATIVGSLRANSNSGRIAKAIASDAPNLVFDIVTIGDLPLYNPDLDASPPAAWSSFRARIKAADAVLFITPEYNRSVPGALKNAIDVGSRPYGQSAFAGKPAAVVSSSMGPIAGFGANHHLRQSLAFLDMPTLQQPEVYSVASATAGLMPTAASRRTTRAPSWPSSLQSFPTGLRATHRADAPHKSGREVDVRLRGRHEPVPHSF